MVIACYMYGSYMFEFSVSKDMEILQVRLNPCFIGREVAVGKVATHLCLAQIEN